MEKETIYLYYIALHYHPTFGSETQFLHLTNLFELYVTALSSQLAHMWLSTCSHGCLGNDWTIDLPPIQTYSLY